jgi:flagellar biosynthesis GTPase FlhF
MTTQNHESMKSLISGLSITRYRGLLRTKLDETERQEIQTLLRAEELWLKRYTLKAN